MNAPFGLTREGTDRLTTLLKFMALPYRLLHVLLVSRCSDLEISGLA